MIDVHAYATPNSLKVPIALEEMGLDYRLFPINLRHGEQRAEAFRAMNPNAKVPVLVDRADAQAKGIVLSESAAILVYLAEKTGQLLPTEPAQRAKVFEQLFFHASGVSPAYLGAFLVAMQSSPQPEAKSKALAEVERVLGVLEHALKSRQYVAGDTYTIADIAHFGWIWRSEAVGASLANFPSVGRWFNGILARPAVKTAIDKTTALAR